ncbi:MAG: ribosome-associated translation inhibitor RaiA [Clostridia bacterium]|nr:ribosome-associated translation inhibitor RaiA [Clostridia bacterium]
MKIIMTGRQMSVYESTKEMAEKKLAKFDKFFDENAEMTVSFSRRHEQEMVEITIRTGGLLFRAEAGAESFANAIDVAVEALERQIRKNKTRLEKQSKGSGLKLAVFDDFDDDDAEFRIRTKTFSVKPMAVEEAILQMNLLGHSFFVFADDITGETCVVYKRKDDDYGLIVPTK